MSDRSEKAARLTDDSRLPWEQVSTWLINIILFVCIHAGNIAIKPIQSWERGSWENYPVKLKQFDRFYLIIYKIIKPTYFENKI